MNNYNIKDMLDKFFEGDTSIQEENEIKEFFSGIVPEELKPLKAQFDYYQAASKEELPSDFDIKLKLAIESQNFDKKVFNFNWVYYLSAVAAVLVLFIAIGLDSGKPAPVMITAIPYLPDDTFKNPDDAYNVAVSALSYISVKMNDGFANIDKMNEMNKYDNEFKNLNKLSLLNEVSNKLFN